MIPPANGDKGETPLLNVGGAMHTVPGPFLTGLTDVCEAMVRADGTNQAFISYRGIPVPR